MQEWEYLWRQTFWAETGRSAGYAEYVTYEHRWRPERNDVPFPDDEGLARLGRAGWELVTMAPGQDVVLSRASPQGNEYTQVTTYLLMFKRPVWSGMAPTNRIR
jgi:hypothetical protein